MGIPILSEIEKLITERGSAAILKERLALASDQFNKLERDCAEKDVLITSLKSEIAKLLDQLALFQNQAIARRNEEEERILVCIAAKKDLTDDGISHHVSLSVAKTHAYLNSMAKAKLCQGRFDMGDRVTRWELKVEGHEYLLRHQLLT